MQSWSCGSPKPMGSHCSSGCKQQHSIIAVLPFSPHSWGTCCGVHMHAAHGAISQPSSHITSSFCWSSPDQTAHALQLPPAEDGSGAEPLTECSTCPCTEQQETADRKRSAALRCVLPLPNSSRGPQSLQSDSRTEHAFKGGP